MPVLRALWIVGLACLFAINSDAILSQARGSEPEHPVDRQVVSLLAGRCLECHGSSESAGGLDLTSQAGLQKGADSGAVTSEPWDKSLLWQVISSEEMPPKGKLSDKEKEILRNWIAQGASLPSEPIDRLGISSEYRAGYDWWALQEIGDTKLPIPLGPIQLPGHPSAWQVRSVIDSQVLEKLNSQGLSPNPQAGPRSLIRRLFIDLVGLPPTFEQVRAFEKEPSDQAYAKIVDELLSSPAYGERWARHWLDVVGFGGSDRFWGN